VPKVDRPTPEPFHPPVGISDETYRTGRRWITLALAVLVVLIGGIVVLLRP
jgi:hypothetical protein